jgi:signal transduction histidine kinase
MNRARFAKPYVWGIAVVGSAISIFSGVRLQANRIDFRFLLLALMVVIASQIALRIPRVSGRITVSDTLIFLTMLLYGGEAAILLSAVDGICSSLPFTRKARTILFNVGMLTTSTALTVAALHLFFGPLTRIVRPDYSANFIVAICVMAMVQYIANTVLIAIEKSSKIDQTVWVTWKKFYLWTSITYFAGASTAGILAHLIRSFGFYAVLGIIPIIAIIYLTYETYLKNIEASEEQTDLAHRHVEELSGYIMELKRSEEERGKLLVLEQQARAEAEAANRIKDEFLATLSHELRTPLTSLLGWANLLRSSERDDALLDQGLEVIERNARSQAQLIEDLLDVSRIISGKLHLDVKTLDLSTTIEAAISVVRPAAEAKSIQLTYVHGPRVGAISGDTGRLQQVVWNLISNAVKFTPEGGRVDVRLEQVDSHARIRVSDNGKGIKAEFLPRVFDRFRQGDSSTTRAYGGLGLGLAIVRHLVELHGGTVQAVSDGEGKGSAFSVMFPLISARSVSGSFAITSLSEGEPINIAPPSLDGLRVLVVDDERDAGQIISRVIAQSGADVRTCESAREALELLKDWKPDVLMSDIGMPGEDGYVLIDKVRSLSDESGGRIPAAALTAYARDEDRQRALAAGYQMHVSKPISSRQLVATVARLAAIRGTW